MSPHHEDLENSNAPIARIDTLDELYVAPIREYLEANGCLVFVNQIPPVLPNYHIVCGDLIFVKLILADSEKTKEKSLAVLWGGTKKEVESLVHTTQTKVWVSDEKLLDSRAVQELFAFFFTSDRHILVSSGEWQPAVQEKETSQRQESERSTIADDQKRIKASIDTIFGDIKFLKEKESHPDQPVKHIGTILKKIRSPKNIFRPIIIILSLAVLLVLPIVWYFITLTVSAGSLYYGARSIKDGDSKRVRFLSGVGQQWVRHARGTLSTISAPIRLVAGNDIVLGQEHVLSLLDNMASAQNGMSDLMEEGSSVASLLLTQAGGDASAGSPAVAIEKLDTSLLFVENRLGLAQAELTRLLTERPFPFSIDSVYTRGIRGLAQLSSYHGSIGYVGNAVALYPQIAGFKEKKTYLVLFQNSMELRPTGGFIGSIALISFSDGRLSDLTVQDVYAVDGQLKGHVDPPGPIRDLLSQEHWYLRDSNWDPDFSVSAARAMWFYEKETGQTVDGVIALSVPLITDLLRVTGPLDLPDYNDRITAENFFGKSLYYTQTDFFPGSTQKKDFLGVLTSSLLTKLTTTKAIPQTALFSVLTKSLQSGDIQLFFNDRQEEDLVSRFGWGGRVPLSSGCEGATSCAFDPMTVNEANLGVNKANYYLDKTMVRQIRFAEDGSSSETLTISYRNTAAAAHGAPGGGAYKAYVRFYVPQGSQVETTIVDGIAVPVRDSKKKTVPNLPYWEKDTTSTDPNVTGVALAVNPGEEKKLSLSYKRPNLITFAGNKAVFEAAFQKQPGVTGSELATEIIFPIFWTSRQLTGVGMLTFLAKEGKLTYNTSLQRSDVIRLEFQK